MKALTAARGMSWSFETTVSLVRVSPPLAHCGLDVVPHASFTATLSFNRS